MADHADEHDSVVESVKDKITEKLHGHDSSSDSDDEKHKDSPVEAVKAKIYRLFGREKLVHKVLGGGKPADIFLWRYKKVSAGVLGFATDIFVFFELLEYHSLTLVCHIDVEQSIVVSDYTQMDRILKEERTSTTLIKSCSAVKGSAIEGEKEILVELEEQLLNMRFQSLHQNNKYISSGLEYSESVSSGSGSSGQECGNTLSTLSFGTAVRGKAGENWFADVHDMRLLYNWRLQWCFVNAKTDSAYFKLTETAEWNLYNAQLATPKLLHSVKSKQTFKFNGEGCMCKEKKSMVLELIQVLQSMFY